MKLIELQTNRNDCMPDNKLSKAYIRLQQLLAAIEAKLDSEPLVEIINQKIQTLNTSDKINAALFRLVNLTENEIINLIEQHLRMVPEGYYSKKWLVLGMTMFGLPIGVIIGILSNNMGLLAVGLPIGMGIGSLIGRKKDAEALAEGRQYSYIPKMSTGN